jgi:hypothetical protein
MKAGWIGWATPEGGVVYTNRSGWVILAVPKMGCWAMNRWFPRVSVAMGAVDAIAILEN